MTEFRLFSASLISLRLADVGITFVVSADLRWEANPLVSVAGLGWGALILANVAGVLLILFFYRYTLVSGGKFFPRSSGTRYASSSRIIFSATATRFGKFIMLFPITKQRFCNTAVMSAFV